MVYRIAIYLHRFLVIVFNIKLDVFPVLQPSQFIIFSHFFSFLLCMQWTTGLLEYFIILEQTVLSIPVHISISSVLDERLEHEFSENMYTVVWYCRYARYTHFDAYSTHREK